MKHRQKHHYRNNRKTETVTLEAQMPFIVSPRTPLIHIFMCLEVEMMASNKRVKNRFIKPVFEGKDRVQTQRMKQMVEAHQRPEHGRNRWVFSSIHKDPTDSAVFSCARVTRPDGCCKDCFGPARPLLAGREGQRSSETYTRESVRQMKRSLLLKHQHQGCGCCCLCP